MRIGKYISAVLNADAAVGAIVGDRIYPVFIPASGTFPCVVYMVNNAPHDQAKDHAGNLDRAVVTFHLWAEYSERQQAYSVLEDLDAAIRTAFDFVEGTSGGVQVEICHYDGSVDGRDENNMAYLKTATYTFIHQK